MAIVALVLYVITAAAGVALLGSGGAARRRAAEAEAAEAAVAAGPGAAGAGAAGPEEAGVRAGTLAPAEAGRVAAQTTSAAAEAVRAPGLQARLAAVPLTADGRPPPGPKIKVAAPPGEHPLLEFSHPALAITGLACWFMYVFVRYTPFAWISFGILMVAITIGLTWLVHNRRAARRRLKGAWHFPPRLVLLHGTAAAVAILLSVLTALSASHV